MTIEAVKKLTGKELKDGEFTFRLKDVNGEVIAEAKNDASGKIKFENLKFEDEGTYEYTVSEVNDKQTGITYDEREFKVTVKVSDNGEGTLSAETGSDDIVFTNSHKAPKDGKTTDTPKKPNKALRRVATGDNSHMVTLSGSYDRSSGSSQHGDYQKKEKIENNQSYQIGGFYVDGLRLANGQKGCVYTVIWSIVISGNDKKSER